MTSGSCREIGCDSRASSFNGAAREGHIRPNIRGWRLATLEAVTAIESLPITADAARRWAELRVRLAREGRRAKVNDLWIAAVASANGMDVVTQDDGFDVIESVGGPRVVRV